MADKQECGNCRFYHQNYSQCQAHPPKVFYDPNTRVFSDRFPSPVPGDWCGEWSPFPLEQLEIKPG